MILKYCLITFKGCLMNLKCFFNDLSSSLNNCWVAEKTTKGGGGKFIKQPLKVIKQYFRIIKKVSQKYFKIIVY